MSRGIDYAKAYYWRIEFIQPINPDDDRYVMLHGDEGEIVGPMTRPLAEAWMDHFDGRPEPAAREPLLQRESVRIACAGDESTPAQ